MLLCSVVGLLLPASVSGRLMSFFQVLVPLQYAVNRGADAIDGTVAGARRPALSAEEVEQATLRNLALRHTITSLRAEIEDLRKDNLELAGIRGRGLDGKLISARVVAPDALAWRESHLIDAGTLRGVWRGAAVASNHFAVNLGTKAGLRDGDAVLNAEVFVGTVDLVTTHTSRVRLVSDPMTRMAVLIARGELGPLDAEYWLVGAGGNRARVEDVDHRYVNEGGIEVGDAVLTVKDGDRLPVSMVVGTVSSIRPDKDNPLLFVLDVELAVDADRLRRVYVVDPIGK